MIMLVINHERCASLERFIPRPDLFEIGNHLALHLASSALLGLKLLDFFDQRVAHDGPERRLVVSHAFSPTAAAAAAAPPPRASPWQSCDRRRHASILAQLAPGGGSRGLYPTPRVVLFHNNRT